MGPTVTGAGRDLNQGIYKLEPWNFPGSLKGVKESLCLI